MSPVGPPAPQTRPVAPARPVTPAGLVAARLRELVSQVDAAGLDGPIAAELRAISALAGGLDPYLERCSSPESAELAALAARTRAHDWASAPGRAALGLEQEMLSGPVEGRFLAMLVHLARARHVLEIGTFTGYAALAMAEALPAGGRVVTCELDPDVAAFARAGVAASAHADRIDIRVGPALDTLRELAGQRARFDLVFLDADKAGYPAYVQAILDHGLLAPHGLLCVDNTLMQGQPWTGAPTPNGEAVAAFNDALAADPRVEQVVVPLRDGVTLARRVDGRAS